MNAFHNVCLHRGRKLRREVGLSEDLRCAFHGFTWNTAAPQAHPLRLGFPHLNPEDMRLPNAQSRTGPVTFSSGKTPRTCRRTVLAPPPEHHKRWTHEDWVTTLWVAKIVKANWKTVAEAFMEAWHLVSRTPRSFRSPAMQTRVTRLRRPRECRGHAVCRDVAAPRSHGQAAAMDHRRIPEI